MSAARPRFLSLAEVARLTGRHPELLRQWCATGRLPCERIGGSWALAEDHVALVQAQPARGRRRGSRPDPAVPRVVVAAAFADATRGRLVHAELVRRFELGGGDDGIAELSLGGADMVLVAVRVPPDHLAEVSALIGELGGRVVADVTEAWFLRPAADPAATRSARASRRP